LKDAGIELEGKIALANYGAIYRGTKVKNAQDNGMIGCVIYTDPMDDGEITEENGYEAYPSMSFLTYFLCFLLALCVSAMNWTCTQEVGRLATHYVTSFFFYFRLPFH
jgi:hypothetical protein